MDDLEWAVNEADAPPASEGGVEDVPLQVPGSWTDAMRRSYEKDLQAHSDDAEDAEVGAQHDEFALEPENEGEDAVEAHSQREGFIPRPRFDEVNSRLHEIEHELEQERLAHEEREEELRHREELLNLHQRALAAGYSDVEQFRRDDEWARANRYGSIEDVQELRRLDSHLQSRGIDDRLRADLLRDKQERIRTSQELAQVRGLLRSVQRSTLDQTISAARAEFGHVDPGQWAQIERLCRDIGHPEGVRRVIETFAPVLKSTKTTAAQQAVIDHNARRAANGNGAPPPEGRGGGRAPDQLPKLNHKEAKSRLLSDLLGFRR